MIKTSEEIKEVRAIASRLEQLGLPRKMADRIRIWVKEEVKRIRNEAHRY